MANGLFLNLNTAVIPWRPKTRRDSVVYSSSTLASPPHSQSLMSLTLLNANSQQSEGFTFSTAVTETASEIFGKHRQKKNPWITAEIFDLCDRRRELRKK